MKKLSQNQIDNMVAACLFIIGVACILPLALLEKYNSYCNKSFGAVIIYNNHIEAMMKLKFTRFYLFNAIDNAALIRKLRRN